MAEIFLPLNGSSTSKSTCLEKGREFQLESFWIPCHNISMPDEKRFHHSIRLRGYDYSLPGFYYITLCTHQRLHLFGTVVDRQSQLSAIGTIAKQEWLRLPGRFHHIELDSFVVMPNHIHAILRIVDDLHGVEQAMNFQKVVAGSIAAVLQAYKASVTRRVRHRSQQADAVIWQRGYWERVLRNEHEIETRRYYIANNPNRWQEDRLNS